MQRFSRRGVSLIEIMVVVALTAMLSTFVILYGSQGRAQVNLSTEAVKLSQMLLRAKSQALLTAYASSSPACGYGVRVSYDSPTYFLFRYKPDGTGLCETPASLDALQEQRIEIMETVKLERGIAFSRDLSTGSRDMFPVDDILFIPPNPSTLLWSNGVRMRDASLLGVYRLIQGTYARTVTVTRGGQISL